MNLLPSALPRRLLLPALLLVCGWSPAFGAGDPAPTALAGSWRIDRARSTELSPWSSLELTLTVAGDRVTLVRRFGAGRRTYTETLDLDLAREASVVPVPWWPDNRHLGAYAGGDRTKRVRAAWLDGGRILRLSSDLVLDTQQGSREVNILSDYKVSANGAQLTLTELRSTRNRPVTYVFTRIPAQP